MAIPKKQFGRTGHQSTRLLFGAAAFSGVTQDEADETMELLIANGINHIDTAASYGDSELRLGPWMETRRGDFFLATKTGERTYDGAKADFERSLRRLRVDDVDLIQLHYLVGDEEWEVAMGPDGALKYLLEAREQGLVKYIGVTGHDVAIARMHQRSLDHFDFDSVLLPYNFPMMQNPTYRAGFEEVQRMCAARKLRPADDQVDHAATLPRRCSQPCHLVRAADRSSEHRQGGALGAGQRRCLPQHRRRYHPAAQGAGGRASLPGAHAGRRDAGAGGGSGDGAAVCVSKR